MKNIFIKYYGLIMLVSFVLYNIILNSLEVSGFLYQVYMMILIIFNIVMLIKFGKEIRFKSFVIIVYGLICLFSKDLYQCLFDFSNIIFLCIIGFRDSIFIKVITILIVLFVMKYFTLLCLIFLFAFWDNPNVDDHDIYKDTHYYCEENMEVYAYSAGAMDKFHYSVGKRYEIININGIIQVIIRKRNETTKENYDDYIKNHKCTLVGEINGFK